MNLECFNNADYFFKALKYLFNNLNIPINIIDDKPISPNEVLLNTFNKNKDVFKLIKAVIPFGIIDETAFSKELEDKELGLKDIKKDYDGILIFGVDLYKRENSLLPTRSQLADITRAFNREFLLVPVVIIFRYSDYITISNIEREEYKVSHIEGEKLGKVSMIRDINTKNTHSGHLKILNDLNIKDKKVETIINGRKTKQRITNFKYLLIYWQSIFNTSILNNAFYKDLSEWYFWAIKNVHFPNAPIHATLGSEGYKAPEVREHYAQNLIRLLTRLLFVWFIKEKGLIPDELFDSEYIQNNLLNNFDPDSKNIDITTNGSSYYRAILQNLFFATLNQKMGKREFRKKDQHKNVTTLMRYQNYFKNSSLFLKLVEDTVPFMNGGLFECLDKPITNSISNQNKELILYIDGFSDEQLNGIKVPNFIFFGDYQNVDLSIEYGKKSKCKVRGLFHILKSYKFTITESTPIEQDIALDPELLGRVFENLLASFNPETKTSARKQTGSFYTPRPIVDYMINKTIVDFLEKKLQNENIPQKLLKKQLEELTSYKNVQPFESIKIKERIIASLHSCKIIDPACGSGAFPMGALQKLVHIIHKIDPNNKLWKEILIDKASYIDDCEIRENAISDIEESFKNNELDYGRKLYLIENCIYGVDIQPIAVQISKLRFFISLIVEQKVNYEKKNIGIRPLPNLETKIVAANTLIGLNSSEKSLFKVKEVVQLEAKLKNIRHRLFSAKSPATKKKLRIQDLTIRQNISLELKKSGLNNEISTMLSNWDPYNQNMISNFFDPEWMFDTSTKFDIVVGNPPYIKERDNKSIFDIYKGTEIYLKYYQGKMDFWYFFLHKSIDLIKPNGVISFITSSYWLNSEGAKKLRSRIKKELSFIDVVDIGKLQVFNEVAGYHMISSMSPHKNSTLTYKRLYNNIDSIDSEENTPNIEIFDLENDKLFTSNDEINFSTFVFNNTQTEPLGILYDVSQGVVQNPDKVNNKMATKFNLTPNDGVFVLTSEELNNLNLNNNELKYVKPFYDESDYDSYSTTKNPQKFILYITKKNCDDIDKYPNLRNHLIKYSKIMEQRRENINGTLQWFHIHWPRNPRIFIDNKIIIPSMFSKARATYNEKESYFGLGSNIITSPKNNNYSLKYLLGLLNSTFAIKWFYTFGKKRGAGVDIGVTKLKQFPVKKMNESDSQKIERLVLLLLNEESNNSSILAEIDTIVNKYYLE